MKCPSCNVDLLSHERSGIAVGHCPNCRGVWLSRADVDKLIDRALADSHPVAAHRPPRFGHDDDRSAHRRHASSLSRILEFQ